MWGVNERRKCRGRDFKLAALVIEQVREEAKTKIRNGEEDQI